MPSSSVEVVELSEATEAVDRNIAGGVAPAADSDVMVLAAFVPWVVFALYALRADDEW